MTYKSCSLTESEPQPNFGYPSAGHLPSIGWIKDTQTAPQKALFEAVQPG